MSISPNRSGGNRPPPARSASPGPRSPRQPTGTSGYGAASFPILTHLTPIGHLTPPVQVGREVPVYQADFGRVGMAICFDVNFPAVWQRLADAGAELVLWPSAYSAGSSLQEEAPVRPLASLRTVCRPG